MKHSLKNDSRGTSLLVEYALILSIMAIFSSLLLFSASSIVETQTDRVVEEEMNLYGQSIAAGFENVDRLVYSKNGSPITISATPSISNEIDSPPYVASIHSHPQENIYTVKIDNINSNKTVKTQMYVSNTDVKTGGDKRIPANKIRVKYDKDNDIIKIQSTN